MPDRDVTHRHLIQTVCSTTRVRLPVMKIQ